MLLSLAACASVSSSARSAQNVPVYGLLGMSSSSEQRSELRLRTRTTLDQLETKDLCNQSSIGLQRICDRCSYPADLVLVLRETLSGLSCASALARRLRFR